MITEQVYLRKPRKEQPRILIYVDPVLFKKFKIHCIKNDISQQDIFDKFLNEYCSKIED